MKMKSKKVYAVAKGIKPGIYNSWDEAKMQVDGFSGALYKSFTSMTEAEDWMKENSGRNVSSNKERSADTHLPKSDEIIIYTDGGSLGNPGPGGYGIVKIYGGNAESGNSIEEMNGGFRLTTNNRMELMGVIVALRSLKQRDHKITLYTDSSYVVNGITKGWAKTWRKNNWIKPDKKPALNPDLWDELLNLTESLDIEFIWVKGHAGNKYNERCDELAVLSARGKNLPVDKGYDNNG
jgi:ribonuclease HI